MRLIDADQFKAKLLSFMDSKVTTPSDTDCILDGVLNLLEEQPTIKPVKHGHWQESKCLNDCFWVCSCCKFPSQAIAAPQLYKYCPNCGAKMDKKEDENHDD